MELMVVYTTLEPDFTTYCKIMYCLFLCSNGALCRCRLLPIEWSREICYMFIYYKDHTNSVHTVKPYRWSRSVALLIFNLGTRWKCVANFTPQLISSGKNPSTHSVGSWVGPRRGLEGLGEEKNIFFLSGFEPWSVQPVATLTTISWLLKWLRTKKWNFALLWHRNGNGCNDWAYYGPCVMKKKRVIKCLVITWHL